MNGSERQITTIIERYRDLVYGVAYASTGDSGAADDLAQEAFVLAWRKLPELEDLDHLGPWLRRTVRNLAANHNRKQRRHVAVAKEVADHGTPLDYFAAHQLLEHVERSFTSLPENQREALTLFYRSESHERTAALLGISHAAARQRVSRARQELRADVDHFLKSDCRRGRDRAALVAAVIAAIGLAPAAGCAAAAKAASTSGRATGAAAGFGLWTWGFALLSTLVVGVLAFLLLARPAADQGHALAIDETAGEVAALVATETPAPVIKTLESADDDAPPTEGFVDQPLVVRVVEMTHPEADLDGNGSLDEDELRAFADSSDDRVASALLALRDNGPEDSTVWCRAVALSQRGVSEKYESYDLAELETHLRAFPGLSEREAILSWVASQKNDDQRICTELTVRRLTDNGEIDGVPTTTVGFAHTARVGDDKIALSPLYFARDYTLVNGEAVAAESGFPESLALRADD